MGILKRFLGTCTELTQYEVESSNLPRGFDGFKLLLVSDFHSRPSKDLLKCIEGKGFDAVFVAGDMADDKKPPEPCYELLKKLVNIAPVYMVSGNHDLYRPDFEEVYQACKKMGIVFLRDETTVIERFGEKIIVHGLDDPNSKRKSVIDERISCGLDKLDRQDGYEILLFHRANKLDNFEAADFDLILTGHMHGGQIRLPYFGGVLSPKSAIFDSDRIFFPKYAEGRHKIGKADAIICRGLGNTMPIPRLGNPREMVSIELTKRGC